MFTKEICRRITLQTASVGRLLFSRIFAHTHTAHTPIENPKRRLCSSIYATIVTPRLSTNEPAAAATSG